MAPLLHIEAALAQGGSAAPETVSEDLDGLPSEEPGAERAEAGAERAEAGAERAEAKGEADSADEDDAAEDTEAAAADDAEAAEAEAADEADDAEEADDADEADVEQPEALGDGEIRSEPVEAPMPFTMLGARVPEGVEVWVRTAFDDGDWTAWTELGGGADHGDGPDPGSEEARAGRADGREATEPLWVGEANRLQVRVEGGNPEDVSVRLIDSMGLGRSIKDRLWDHLRGVFRTATANAHSFGPQYMVSRGEWGADESLRRRDPSYARDGVKAAVVHHTAGTNYYSRDEAPGIVRGIYDWHVRGNGWNDIGYNMLVDRYGTLYEGRYGGIEKAVIGAHAAGWNTGTFGISVMGNFDTARIPSEAVEAVTKAIGYKAAVADFDPTGTAKLSKGTISAVFAHRNVGSTSCPGAYFYPKLDEIRTGAAFEARVLGGASDIIQLSGDWNADGVNRPGWFVDGRFYLRKASGGAHSFPYGTKGDLPIVGDWNGNGQDTVGVVRDGRWYLRYSNSKGPADKDFKYGRVLEGDYPLAGDWNGNGQDTVGIVRDGEWHLRNKNSGGPGQIVYTYGRVRDGDIPLMGDWSGDGQDTPAIVRGREWHLRYVHKAGEADTVFKYGASGDLPVVGDWNLSDVDTPAVARGTTWYLRNHNSSGPANVQMEFAPE